MSLVPFTAKDCVVCIYYYYVKRQVVNGKMVYSCAFTCAYFTSVPTCEISIKPSGEI